jgi:outer membrane lipoprotein-sorting protein
MKAASRLVAAYAVLIAGGVAEASERAPAAGAWTVDQVLTALKDSREPSVPFEEATYSSLLAKPLIVRGVLSFTPPSRLEKDVREPYRERYIVDGDLVTFESERRHVTKTISLEDYPGLRGFVDAFRALLTGDAARLKQTYETSIEGVRQKWVVRLRARDQAEKSFVDSIEVSGSEGRIDTITILASDGDRSVMTLLRGAVP